MSAAGDFRLVSDRRRSGPAPALPAMPCVVAYGAGDNSTALLVGMARRGWRPDLILFADTGSERPHTYAYLSYFDDWLRSVGFPPLTAVKNASPIAGDASLYDECHRKKVLPSLAYGGHSCSLKWKVAPQDRYCREFFGWRRRRKGDPADPPNGETPPGRWDHGPWVLKLIGYDAGPRDARRIERAKGKWPPGYRYRYPLQEWDWDRDECVRQIVRAGLRPPGKSACFMCPACKWHEVQELAANHPELASKAMQLEVRAHERGLTTTRGLGRNWNWTERLNATPATPPFAYQPHSE